MAFPKLLTKLFQNDGAGPMLRTDIILTDSSLSSTSTNAIQNKVVTSAFASANEYADSTGYQVGDIKLYAGSNVPNGWFRCDGSTIADMATNYPKLYAVLGTNVLPNYSGRVPLGASSDINTAVEAGLPNINGEFAPRLSVGFLADGVYTGAFSAGNDYGTAQVEFVKTSPHVKLNFNASNCSSIYGKSTTVQPPAVKVAVLIKHD